MAGIDINRTTSGITLPAAVSAEIWAATLEESAIMRLARRVELPGSGVTVPTITGEAAADWVDETDEKPVSRPTFGSKTMTPHTLAVIVPFSNQFRRDLPALYRECVRRLPAAIGSKFDATIFHGTAPGSGFDVLSSATAVAIDGTSTYADFLSAVTTVAANGGVLNGWALSPQAEAVALGALADDGRPLFITDLQREGSIGALLGRPAYLSRAVYNAAATPDTLGFAGDWSMAQWGSVEGIQLSIADQATLTDGEDTINLWQRNMFAVRVEAELGFVVRDTDYFVKLTVPAA